MKRIITGTMRRILAGGLAALVMFSSVPTEQIVLAQNKSQTNTETVYNVLKFEKIKNIEIPYDTAIENIELPDTIKATLERTESISVSPFEAVDENEKVTEEQLTEEQTTEETSTEEQTTEEVDLSVEWTCEDYDSKKTGQYIFYASFTEDTYNNQPLHLADGVSMQTVIVTVVENTEKMMLISTVDEFQVTLTADSDVFPVDAYMEASLVDNKKELTPVEAAVEKQRDEAKNVSEAYVFDIKVYDNKEDKNEIQPDTDKGSVQVSFALAKQLDENREINVYHIKEESNEKLTAEALDVAVEEVPISDRVESISEPITDKTKSKEETETVLSVETDGFSYYVVEFTVGDLQYVLDGDSSIPLSTILETLHMSGLVTAAKGSDDSLFTVTKDETGDDWTVTAVTAFSSNEALDLTINGVKYTITVTDDNTVWDVYYTTSENVDWHYSTDEDNGDPFNNYTGFLWVNNQGSNAVDIDLGNFHENFTVCSGQKLIITSTGGGSVRVWSGGKDNVICVESGGMVYIGANVKIDKKEGGGSGIASYGGTVWMGGTCKTGSGTQGLWTKGTTTLHLLSGYNVDTSISGDGGSWSTTNYYKYLDSRPSTGVASISAPGGAHGTPQLYENKYYFSSGSYASFTAYASEGYYITNNGSQSVNADFYAYPTATQKMYYINYYQNMGSGSTSVSKMPSNGSAYYFDSYYIPNVTPIRTGYTFLGWNTNSTATTPAWSPGTTTNSFYHTSTTYNLYAIWRANTNNLTMEENLTLLTGGERDKFYSVDENGFPSTATFDTVLTVPSPACGGYKFVGWEVSGYNSSTAKFSTTSNSSSGMTSLNSTNGIISVTDETAPVYLLNLNPTDNASVTLKARWEVANYNITYLDKKGEAYSGSTIEDSNKTYTYGQSKNIKTLPTVTKDGYYFVGWFTDIECTSTATRKTQIDNTEYGDKTYYARWSEYPLSLQNGGFEAPVNTSFFRQYYNETPEIWWKTSATDKKIEIGSIAGNFANSAYSAYHTRVAADGKQFAELNATQVGALYQYVATVPGETLFYGFSHRGRKGNDTMQVWIGSPLDIEIALAQYVSAGNSVAGVEETLLSKIAQKPTEAEAISITDNYDVWKAYTGFYVVDVRQDETAFAFVSVSSAGNDISIGNLLDNIYFTAVQPTNIGKTLSITATAGGSIPISGGITITKNNSYSQTLTEGTISIVQNQISANKGYTYNGGFVNGKYYSAKDMNLSFDYASLGKSTEIIYLFSEDGSVYLQSGDGIYTDDTLTDSMTVLKPVEGKDTYTLGAAEHAYMNFVGWKLEGTDKLIPQGSRISYVTEGTDGNAATYLVIMDQNVENKSSLAKVSSNDGMVLSAQFTNKEMYDQTIIMNPDGGSYSDSSIIHNNDEGGTSQLILDTVDTTYVVKKPIKTGYTFMGWKYTDRIVLNEGDTITYSLSEDYQVQLSFGNNEPVLMTEGVNITLTALWKANTYTVTYNANGGTGTMSTQELSYEKEETLNLNQFTRTGYTFLGWSRSESATEPTYSNSQEAVFNMSATDGGKVTLYAVWKSAKDYPTSLQNGSFEYPVSSQWTQKYNDRSTFAGIAWYTSASDKKVEIGNPTQNQNASFSAYHTTTASDGKQFAELNANQVGALYQSVATAPGDKLYWGLDHRGRWGNDTMQLWIGAPDEITEALRQYTQAGNKVTGVNADLLTKIAQVPEGQTSANITDNDVKWVTYNGSYTVPANQEVSIFAFVSVASAGNDKSCGNLLDNVYFSVEKPVQTNEYTISSTSGGYVTVYYDGFDKGSATTTDKEKVELTAEYSEKIRLVVKENTNYTYNGAYIDGKYYTVDQVNEFLDNLSWTVGDPAENMNITFLFSADSTVIFEPMGGIYETSDNPVGKVNLKARGSREYTLAAPSLAHFVFSGWLVAGTEDTLLEAGDIVKYETDSADGSTYLNVYRGSSKVYSKATEQGMNLVAQYNLNTSTVTTVEFDTDGGYYADAQVRFDGTIDYTLDTPIKTGYEFTGWIYGENYYPAGTVVTFSWNPDGSQRLEFNKSATDSAKLGTVSGQETITLKASWKTVSYASTLSENSAHVTADTGFESETAVYGAAWTGIINADTGYSLPDTIEVTIDGKSYDRFTYVESTGTITVPENVVYGPIVVTARATENQYKISLAQTDYLTMPGTTTATYANAYTDYITVTEGYQLPASLTATMDGNAFTDFEYTNGKISIEANKILGDIVFTGVASAGVYTIHLDGNGATTQNTTAVYEKYNVGFYTDINCSNIVNNSNNVQVPERTGYTFTGYYTQVDGNGVCYIQADGTLDSGFTNTTLKEDGTLYAGWKQTEYTLTSELTNVSLEKDTDSGISTTLLQRVIKKQEGTIHYGTDVKFTLTVASHYDLPATISVTGTSVTLSNGTDYSYDKNTGKVVIYGTAVTDNLAVAAVAAIEQVNLCVSTGTGGTVSIKVGESEPVSGTSIEQEVAYNSEVTLTAVPATDGDKSFSFVGWYNMSSGEPAEMKNVIESEETNPKSYSVTITIQSASQYTAVFGKDLTVILDGQGGKFTTEVETTKTLSYGNSWNIAEIKPEKDGYQFAGWKLIYASQPDNTGIAKNEKGYCTAITNNYSSEEGEDNIFTATLQAVWTPDTFSVTYNNVYSGEVETGYNAYTTGSGFKQSDEVYTLTLPMLARDGYIFQGWYDAETGGSLVTSLRKDDFGEKTFYARWRAISYMINYLANGGTGQMASQKVNYGDSVPLTIFSGITRTGYSFSGWNTQETGSGTSYTNQQSITNLTKVDGSQIDLYAQWAPVEYTITYESQGGNIQGTDHAVCYTFGIGAALPTSVTKTGYTFEGWYKNSAGTGDPIGSIGITASGNKTYYAKWTAASYKIEYKNLGNIISQGTINETYVTEYTYGDYIVLPTDVTRKDNKFLGWYTSESAEALQVKTISTTDSGAMEFFAKWEDASGYEAEWMIGGKSYYGSLEEAFKYATEDEDTITIQKDVLLKDNVSVPNGVTLVIPDKVTLSMEGGYTLTNDGTIDNHGYLSGNGTFDNNGTIENAEGRIVAHVDNDGGTINAGIITFDGSISGGNLTGNITNNGTITDPEKIENGTLTNNNLIEISSDKILMIGEAGNFVNNQTIKNEGTITGTGKLDNNGLLDDAPNGKVDLTEVDNTGGEITGGVIGNATTIKDGSVSGEITNRGTLNNVTIKNQAPTNNGTVITGGNYTGQTTNNGTVTGDVTINGTFNNNQTIRVEDGEKLLLNGTLNNGKDRDGEILNQGTIIVNGTLNNGTGTYNGTIENGYDNVSGKISVEDTNGILTHGTIQNGDHGTLNNTGYTPDSIINLNKKGTIESTGLTAANDKSLVIADKSTQITLPEGQTLGKEIYDSVLTEDELHAAIENGKTDIYIAGDIELSKDFTIPENVTIHVGEENTLNTNGHKLTISNDAILENTGVVAGEIVNNGTFGNKGGTIGDGTLETTITSEGQINFNGGTIEAGATLTPDTITGEVTNKGTLVIENITKPADDTTPTLSITNEPDAELTIKNSEITGNIVNNGKLELDTVVIDGSFENITDELTIKGDKLQVAGGIINSGTISGDSTLTPPSLIQIITPSIDNTDGTLKNLILGETPTASLEEGTSPLPVVTGGKVDGFINNNGELKGVEIPASAAITNGEYADVEGEKTQVGILNGCDIAGPTYKEDEDGNIVVDEEGNPEIDIPGATINGGVTYYKITFSNNGLGSTTETVYGLQPGDLLTKPLANPKADGYIFGGWYRESECIRLWNFAVDVFGDGNFILYAKWNKIIPTSNNNHSSSGANNASSVVTTDIIVTATTQQIEANTNQATSKKENNGTQQLPNGITPEAIQDMKNQMAASSETAIKEMLEEQVERGKVSVVNITSNKAVSAQATIDSMIEIIKAALSEEEQARVLLGETVSFSVLVEDNTDTVKNDLVNAIEKQLEEKSKIGAILNVSMFKQIGNDEAVDISEQGTSCQVTFEIPEHLKAQEGVNRSYTVLRIYIAQDGSRKVETVSDVTIDKFKVTMTADTTSSYAIIFEDEISLSDSTYNYQQLKMSAKCNWHWYMLLLMLGFIAFVMIGRKKSMKAIAIVFVVDVILTIILVMLGSCGMDIPFAVGTLVVAGVSVPVKRITGKNEEEEQDDIEE